MAGDLNLKKSWNPALIKNQKKVWDQEQQKLQELTKIKQKNQEYEQEQDYINLLKLQYGNDFKLQDLNKSEKLKLTKLNWMYEDVPFVEEKETKNEAGFIESSNEFTEGKSKVENLLKGSHSFRSKSKENTNDRLNRIIGVGVKKVSEENLSDDPLIRIKQQQIQMNRNKSKSSGDRQSHRHDRDSEKHRHKHNRDSERHSKHSNHRHKSEGEHRHSSVGEHRHSSEGEHRHSSEGEHRHRSNGEHIYKSERDDTHNHKHKYEETERYSHNNKRAKTDSYIPRRDK